MRKAFSILLALIVLLTGIHLSVASHMCQGKLVDVNISVAGNAASTCSMEEHDTSSPAGSSFKKQCCESDLAKLIVDSNYSPSFFKNIDVAQKDINVAGIPLTEVIRELAFVQPIQFMYSPPPVYPVNEVELTEICIFRI